MKRHNSHLRLSNKGIIRKKGDLKMKMMKMETIRNQKVKNVHQNIATIRVMMKVILKVNTEHLDNTNRYQLSCRIINRNCLKKVKKMNKKRKVKMRLLKGNKTHKKKLIKMIVIMSKKMKGANVLIDKNLKESQEEKEKKNKR